MTATKSALTNLCECYEHETAERTAEHEHEMAELTAEHEHEMAKLNEAAFYALRKMGGVSEVQSLRQRVKELELMLQHRSEKAVILAGGAGEEVLSGGL